MRLIAEEGKPLPAKYDAEFTRLHDDSSVEIAVFQDDTEVGEVRVDDISNSAGAGSRVVVTVEITEKNEMRGPARVLNAWETSWQLSVRCGFTFPPTILPNLAELKGRFEELEGQRSNRSFSRKTPPSVRNWPAREPRSLGASADCSMNSSRTDKKSSEPLGNWIKW